ncbi:MAG: HAD-IB family hydrolase [Sphingomonas sp.]
MRHLAIYDMDKTITAAPTWTRFLVHAAWARARWRLALLPAVAAAGIGYLVGLTNRGGLKQIAQRLMLGRAVSPAAMAAMAEDFADAVTAEGVLPGARDRIAADRAAGYTLVLATASHGYYAAAIGRRLGFDHVVATAAARDAQGHILSIIEGDNCYGAVKLRMVEALLAGEGIARADVYVRAYSDHVSDAPLLAWADAAFAVNAHGPLRAMALERGWPLLDWRG